MNNGSCSAIGSLGKYYCACAATCNSDFNCSFCNDQKPELDPYIQIERKFLLVGLLQIFYFFLILSILLLFQRILNNYCFKNI